MFNHKGKSWQIIPRLYMCVLAAMILLMVYMGVSQRADAIQNEPVTGSRILEASSCTEIQDDTAPAGIRKEYILDGAEPEQSNDCLAFYVVRQYVQVYLDEELIYSLTPKNSSFVCQDVGCNWVIIPLGEECRGRQIRVVATPVYEEVKNRTLEFRIGSRYMVSIEVIREDLDEILLSVLAIGVGIAFIMVFLVSLLQQKEKTSLLYLGMFSGCLGIWKITDIRSASLLFIRHPMLVSQVSLAALGLAIVPFALFIRTQFKGKTHRLLDLSVCISLGAAILQILLQLTGIMDLRESLKLSHLAMGVTVVAVAELVAAEWRRGRRNRKLWITMVFFVLCAAGAVSDMLLFYLRGTSFGITNTIILFVLYIIIMGSLTLMEINQQASIDYGTGLYNRSRCSELIKDDTVLEEHMCFMMFDLNQLKAVNDTLGHEAGDGMILRFAEALRQNIPASAFLGRYGGDEFIALIGDCTREKALDILAAVDVTVREDNEIHSEGKVCYAAGYALSDEFPGSTVKMLLEKADQDMYENKRAYYENIHTLEDM